MKVALLSAIVFGAISAAAASSQALVEQHHVQHGAHPRSHASAKANGRAKTENASAKHHRVKHSHKKLHVDEPPPAGHFTSLHKRQEKQVLELGDSFANALKGALGDGRKGGDTIINHYGSGATGAGAHMPGGAYSHMPGASAYMHPYGAALHPPPTDPSMVARLEKIEKHIGKLKDAHKLNSQQIQMMEELQARQMASRANAEQAATLAGQTNKKRGPSKTAMVLGGAGLFGAGWGLTKLLDTKPSDSTTGYSQQDLAAVQGAGGAAPGDAPVAGYPQGAAQAAPSSTQGSSQDDIAVGPYPIPGTSLVWIADRQNKVHVYDQAQNFAEVNPPAGWQPTIPSGGGAASAGGVGPGAGTGQQQTAEAGGQPTGNAGAPSTQYADTSAYQTGGAQPTQNTGDQGAQGNSAPGAQSGGATTAPGSVGQGSDGTKPTWDPEWKMYSVIGPDNVKYLIDNEDGLLINSVTGDFSDPKTGQIVYRGSELMNGSTSGGAATNGGAVGTGASGGQTGGATGAGTGIGAGTGAGTGTGAAADAGAGAGTADTGTGSGFGTAGGVDAGSGTGRMQKRSIRHRKLDKRQYETAALRATNPSLREQATLAMLRGQTYGPSPQAAMIKRPGMGKVLLKGAAGVGAIAALFIGLGAYAHPSLPNTTPDNEYGLVPTAFCDVYGEPIMRDFRGVLWNKSTYARLDLKNPPPLHYCSDQELADAGYAAQGGGSAQAGGPTPMQKRSSQERTTAQFARLVAAVREDAAKDAASGHSHGKEHGHALDKRQMKGVAAAALLPSISGSGALAIAGTALITAIYLHSIHEQKEKALMQQWNSQYHSAGEAASSVGNAIETGANGQLFNPLTGNLILVDPNTNNYYDSGTGEQVNPKTGMPFKYGGDDSASRADSSKSAGASAQQLQPMQLPLDSNGNMSGDPPQVQQALEQWNSMSPQQQQQLWNQYGGAANQILSSPDPNAALQTWSSQQGQPQPQPQPQPQLQPQPQPQPQPQQALYGNGGGYGSAGSATVPGM